MKKPNILFVFGDQWRAQATGYAGDPNVKTPNLDEFAAQNINFTNAVSGCPVCSPYRASLFTGVYPNRHKMMCNDRCLPELYEGPFLAECLRDDGYQTAYVGKWHIDGKGRLAPVAPERRLGFDFWRGFECTHEYNESPYYAGDDPRPHIWKGYDADMQTDEACRFIKEETGDDPFVLFLSWGPPHNPYQTAPAEFAAMYDPKDIVLRDNVPAEKADKAREELAGYYAHCSALDACFGRVMKTLEETGHDKDTIVIFTSDHGDMLHSQGHHRKQRPWAEAIRVPFLVRHPEVSEARCHKDPVDAPDLMPTILSLCGVPVPEAVQGKDFSSTILSGEASSISEALYASYSPFGEWNFHNGGLECRGLHSDKYTYVRTLEGPWLLYDNDADPLQKNNLIAEPACAGIVAEMDAALTKRLELVGDDFVSGREIIAREGIQVYPNNEISYDFPQSPLPEPYEDKGQ